MPLYVQADRPLRVTTPLGPDALLLIGFSGREAVSELFQFDLDLLAENGTDVPFDKLLGQKAIVDLVLPEEKRRYFSGQISRISQGQRDNDFTRYHIQVVPQFWFLTRKAQSRIFQHLTIPDILKAVLDGLDVAYELQGTFEPRDFCVQYRETDFNFASRLMEEEGIYYFFKHTSDGHKMVVANTPQSHLDLPEPSRLIFEEVQGGVREEDRVVEWEKVQELRSGKYTLWDHCFELPHKHLEAGKAIQDAVQVGKVNHKLKVGPSDKLELYDYPGAYAQRFDGIDRGGGERPADVQKIFQDNQRTVEIRMQEEAQHAFEIRGVSTCGQLVSGHKFTLERHFNADGRYVLTALSHSATVSGDYRSRSSAFSYENRFTCIPFALPYRPPRVTPKPVVQGTQTAVVVGPAGDEIFTDKYGRVKVQFHWDRAGKNDADSSCWVRVGTPWAGKNWGMISIPRIGHEVIVDFLEGDPDQPIIIGSVYNADMMPPYKLPEKKTQSTCKSRSSLQGAPSNFNEIRFEDKKGSEQLFINAERELDLRVEADAREFIGHDRALIVKSDQKELVEKDQHLHVKGKQFKKVDGDVSLQIGGAQKEKITGDVSLHIASNQMEKVDKDVSLTVGMNQNEKVGMKYALESGQEIHLKAGMKVIIEAGVQLTLKGPGGFVDINPTGVTIQGTMVLINSGGSAGSGSGSSPTEPKAPEDPKAPDVADDGSKVGKMND